MAPNSLKLIPRKRRSHDSRRDYYANRPRSPCRDWLMTGRKVAKMRVGIRSTAPEIGSKEMASELYFKSGGTILFASFSKRGSPRRESSHGFTFMEAIISNSLF